ncbi:hypothetical protein ACQ4PT_005138 [Festuca glaucescens]
MAHSARPPRLKYASLSLSPSCLQKLRVPAEFAARLEPGAGDEEAEVTVMGPVGKVWRVELRWEDGECWLGNGWAKLAAALGIAAGWSVVLRRERRGVATLSAFDPGRCLARLCTPHAGVTCKNRPRFIKLLQPDDLEKMRIPDKFVQQHLTEAGACISSQNAMIFCPLRKFWRVKLDHGHSDVLHGEDWPQFVTAHDLSEGNILLFRYEGNMVLSVEVFLRNGCLKEYHTTLALCVTDGGARGPSSALPQSGERPVAAPFISKKRKNDKNVVYAISAPVQPQSKPAAISPRDSFAKEINNYALHKYLRLPAEFAARLEPGAGEEEREVIVMGPLGKVWRVELRWQDGVCWLGSGWPELAAALGIGAGWSIQLLRGVATLSAFDPGCCLARLCTPHAGVMSKHRHRFIKLLQPDDLEKMPPPHPTQTLAPPAPPSAALPPMSGPPAFLDGASGAIVPAVAAVPPGSAPRSVGPVVLSFTAGNYTKWSIYLKASLGHAGLLGHIDGTIAVAPTKAAWCASDYTVLNVLHAAIDEDVADMVLSSNQTARQLWLAARDLFTANKASKAIYLDNDFRQLVQGASSVTEYCRCLKQIADALADNDSAVSDRTLVLNTLRGLSPRFSAAATVISMTEPLPSFLRVRGMLLMEEMQQANAVTNTASIAMVTQARPPPPPCNGTACRGDSSNSGKPKQVWKSKGKNGGKNTANRSATPALAGPWVCFSPGAGAWRPPTSTSVPGILGPRPQAYHTTSAPLFQSSPTNSAPGNWDTSALITALNNLALQQGG